MAKFAWSWTKLQDIFAVVDAEAGLVITVDPSTASRTTSQPVNLYPVIGVAVIARGAPESTVTSLAGVTVPKASSISGGITPTIGIADAANTRLKFAVITALVVNLTVDFTGGPFSASLCTN